MIFFHKKRGINPLIFNYSSNWFSKKNGIIDEIDAINVAEINNPELLDKIFIDYSEGASKDPYKYISNKKLYVCRHVCIIS